jgi:hypothetical protein
MSDSNSNATAVVVDLDSVPCEDFTYFKNSVMRHRKDDDNIAHRLNTTDTHSEAQCRRLFEVFTRSYGEREKLIHRCLQQQQEVVEGLRARRQVSPNDLEISTALRTEQLKASHLFSK